MRIDLHTHSTESDGTQAPADVVASAREAGLDVLALTDHDTTRGWAAARGAAQAAGLGGLFAALVGEQGLTLASELVFGTRALFALSALLIGLAFWLVGRRREGMLVSA